MYVNLSTAWPLHSIRYIIVIAATEHMSQFQSCWHLWRRVFYHQQQAAQWQAAAQQLVQVSEAGGHQCLAVGARQRAWLCMHRRRETVIERW